MMVGRKLENEFPKRNVRIGEPRLSVRGLSRGNDVKDVSFEVRRGEVLHSRDWLARDGPKHYG